MYKMVRLLWMHALFTYTKITSSVKCVPGCMLSFMPTLVEFLIVLYGQSNFKLRSSRPLCFLSLCVAARTTALQATFFCDDLYFLGAQTRISEIIHFKPLNFLLVAGGSS